LICLPHLLNAAALPWEKLITGTTYEHFGHFLWEYVGGSEKSQFFGADMRIQTWKWTLTVDARSDHHWQPCRQLSSKWYGQITRYTLRIYSVDIINCQFVILRVLCGSLYRMAHKNVPNFGTEL